MISNSFRKFLVRSDYQNELKNFDALTKKRQNFVAIIATLAMIGTFGRCNHRITRFVLKRFQKIDKSALTPSSAPSRTDDIGTTELKTKKTPLQNFEDNSEDISRVPKVEGFPSQADSMETTLSREVSEGCYVLVPNVRETECRNSPYASPEEGALHKVPIYQTFLQQDTEDPFRQQIRELVPNCGIPTLVSIKDTTTSQISIPNLEGIEELARYYREKYQIAIHVANCNTILTVLQNLNQTITSPTYLGIIASWNDLAEHSTAHVVPFLVYFPGNGKKEKMEAISLDSTAQDYYYTTLCHFGISAENIYYSSKIRQADGYSCHTDALVILRNALLSLRYQNIKNGFHDALQGLKIENGKITPALPPEWDYTSQVGNKELTDQLAIRTLYSKKTKQTETAFEHRRKHTQTHTFKVAITFFGALKDVTAKPPNGVTYTQKNRRCKITFTYDKEINTYLLDKGHRLAQGKAKALK